MAHTKVTKTYSQNTGVANTFSYSGSFDVFKATEVVVELDNVELTYTASTINESASPREYTVDTVAKTIHIGGADLSSGAVIIRPNTDMGEPSPRATYTPGSSITADDLNNNQLQIMRKCMEYDETLLSTTGGTMTGQLIMGEDQTIAFEGATDNAYETTLTVTDPTADRTITLPNVTGTVVTTGDTGTITATMLAADSVDSSELVDGSIDASHISSSAVTTAKIAADAVTGAKIADDAIDSEHYTDGSIDTAHIGAAQVTTAKLADDAVTTVKITDGNVTTAKIAADAITGAKIADDQINSEHYIDGSIDTAHIADDQITTAKIADVNVTTAKLANDAVTGAKIADDSIDSEHYVAASIDNEHLADDAVGADELAANAVVNDSIASNAAIAHSKLASVTDGQILVGNGSNVPTSVAVSGDVTIANTGAVTIANDAVEIGMIGCEQTTISDSDSHIPTSGAVVDYVAAQIAPIGGLEVIADEDNFPSTQPAAGVVISIADAGGIVVNGSGTSTTARTAGNGSDNVTINNINSQFHSTTLAAGVGMQVSSTGSGHVYNYHKALLKEADLANLSNDINDFGNRYRVNAGEPSSDNDEGDLVYDTNANKMKVYDGSSWGEVTSTGDFKFLVAVDAGTTTAATWDGSDTSFDLKETSASGSAASVTSVNQLIVSLNGVIQKPNTGSYDANEEGFYLTDADTIRFCTAPPSGSSAFIIQCGSAVSIPTPGDGTVSAAKIAAGAVTADKIATGAIEQAKMADNSINTDHYVDASIDRVHLVADIIDGTKIADDAVGAEHIEVLDANLQLADDSIIQLGTSNEGELYHNSGGVTVLRNNADSKDLYIQAKQDSDIIINANDTGNQKAAVFKFSNDATPVSSAELYYGDSKKFETTSAGATVTGTLTADLADNSIDSEHYTDGSIDNEHLADNAVDLAEMAHGTQGDVLYYGSGGAPARLGAGTNGYFLKTQGGSANPVWAEVSGGVGSDTENNTTAGANAGNAGTWSGANDNTCVGYNAGTDLTSADYNTLVGSEAGANLTTGYKNVAVGQKALETSTNGFENVAIGWSALPIVPYGTQNVAVGCKALESGDDAGIREEVAVGFEALKDLTGNYTNAYGNTALGYQAGRDNDDKYEMCFIGRQAGMNQTMVSQELWIAHRDHNKGTASCWIHGTSNGEMTNGNNSSSWSTTSDERIKKNIVDNNVGLEKLNQLKVRNFEYRVQKETGTDSEGHTTWTHRSESDIIDTSTFNTLPNGQKPRPDQVAINKEGVQVGCIAQEVEAVLPGCVHTDTNGVKSVDTDEMFWVMVNSIKQLSAKNDALEARIATLEAA